jgi:hypothetical protein
LVVPLQASLDEVVVVAVEAEVDIVVVLLVWQRPIGIV